MDPTEKRLEARIRRKAWAKGYRVHKSRQRTQVHANNKGAYRLVQNQNNTVVLGVDYDADLEQIDEFLSNR